MKLVVITFVLKLMDSINNVSADSISNWNMNLEHNLNRKFLMEWLTSIPLKTFYLISKNKKDNFHYEATNQTVADIKNGIIFPKKEGLIKIIVFDELNTKQKTIEVTVVPESKDPFDRMRQSWTDIVLGDSFYDPKDSAMLRVQKERDAKALKMWKTMNTNEDRNSLWAGPFSEPKHITAAFENLLLLSTTVMSQHSSYYLNREILIDTLSGLNWLTLNKYNMTTHKFKGNWWDWEIGIPMAITKTLTVMYPILSEEEISAYLREIDLFLPDPNYRGRSEKKHFKTTAANQVNNSWIKMLQNILRKDGKGITKAIQAMMKIFLFVKKGDGFYEDGSFLQHDNVAYTGSYGRHLLTGLSEILTVIQSTEYAIFIKEIYNVYTWITEAYAPLVHKGNMMDMVRGRAISYSKEQSSMIGADVIRSIINIAEFSKKKEAIIYKKLVKLWIQQNYAYNYFENFDNYRDIYLAKGIVNDPSIETNDVLETKFKNYAIMNRVVYRNVEKDFALGISMSSKRIARYSSLNNENIHGWFTGDGMIYLYNSDLSQFNDDFWPTVDPYRLPGITVRKVQRRVASGANEAEPNFVGASILDSRTGMVAMDFVNYGATVRGRKSWTVFDNKVIALGSVIKTRGVKRNVVETIFENRKLNEAIEYKLYINNEEIDYFKSDVNSPRKVLVNRIYLEASDKTQSIGYKLLTPQNLTIKIEKRKGAWRDIHKDGSPTLITRKYFTIWKTHEEENDDYNYVIYPGISKQEFDQEYSVRLMQNNEYVQVIKDANKMKSDTEKIGATIFEHGVYLFENMIITQPMILSRKDTANSIEIAVSDPSMEQVASYIIKLTDKNYKIKAIDQNIKAYLKNGFWKIIIDPTNKLGQSSIISFNLID